MVYIYMYSQVKSLPIWDNILNLNNSLHASGELCRLPIVFPKQFLNPDEDYRMSALIWIQTVWHSDSGPGGLFVKLNFEESQQMTIKTWTIP